MTRPTRYLVTKTVMDTTGEFFAKGATYTEFWCKRTNKVPDGWSHMRWDAKRFPTITAAKNASANLPGSRIEKE